MKIRILGLGAWVSTCPFRDRFTRYGNGATSPLGRDLPGAGDEPDGQRGQRNAVDAAFQVFMLADALPGQAGGEIHGDERQRESERALPAERVFIPPGQRPDRWCQQQGEYQVEVQHVEQQ